MPYATDTSKRISRSCQTAIFTSCSLLAMQASLIATDLRSTSIGHDVNRTQRGLFSSTLQMSACSCSSSSSLRQLGESNNSYSSLASSSLTNVSSLPDDEHQHLVQDHWRFERQVSLTDPPVNKKGSILKATMTRDRILIDDALSARSTLIFGKHVSMRVVFNM